MTFDLDPQLEVKQQGSLQVKYQIAKITLAIKSLDLEQEYLKTKGSFIRWKLQPEPKNLDLQNIGSIE